MVKVTAAIPVNQPFKTGQIKNVLEQINLVRRDLGIRFVSVEALRRLLTVGISQGPSRARIIQILEETCSLMPKDIDLGLHSVAHPKIPKGQATLEEIVELFRKKDPAYYETPVFLPAGHITHDEALLIYNLFFHPTNKAVKDRLFFLAKLFSAEIREYLENPEDLSQALRAVKEDQPQAAFFMKFFAQTVKSYITQFYRYQRVIKKLEGVFRSRIKAGAELPLQFMDLGAATGEMAVTLALEMKLLFDQLKIDRPLGELVSIRAVTYPSEPIVSFARGGIYPAFTRAEIPLPKFKKFVAAGWIEPLPSQDLRVSPEILGVVEMVPFDLLSAEAAAHPVFDVNYDLIWFTRAAEYFSYEAQARAGELDRLLVMIDRGHRLKPGGIYVTDTPALRKNFEKLIAKVPIDRFDGSLRRIASFSNPENMVVLVNK